MQKYPLPLRLMLGLVIGALMGFVGITLLQVSLEGIWLEELLKLGGIWLVRAILGRLRVEEGLAVGLGFGITEAVLYSLPILMNGSGAIGARILVTVPMHAASGGMMANGAWGIMGALLFHGLFNHFVR